MQLRLAVMLLAFACAPEPVVVQTDGVLECFYNGYKVGEVGVSLNGEAAPQVTELLSKLEWTAAGQLKLGSLDCRPTVAFCHYQATVESEEEALTPQDGGTSAIDTGIRDR